MRGRSRSACCQNSHSDRRYFRFQFPNAWHDDDVSYAVVRPNRSWIRRSKSWVSMACPPIPACPARMRWRPCGAIHPPASTASITLSQAARSGATHTLACDRCSCNGSQELLTGCIAFCQFFNTSVITSSMIPCALGAVLPTSCSCLLLRCSDGSAASGRSSVSGVLGRVSTSLRRTSGVSSVSSPLGVPGSARPPLSPASIFSSGRMHAEGSRAFSTDAGFGQRDELPLPRTPRQRAREDALPARLRFDAAAAGEADAVSSAAMVPPSGASAWTGSLPAGVVSPREGVEEPVPSAAAAAPQDATVPEAESAAAHDGAEQEAVPAPAPQPAALLPAPTGIPPPVPPLPEAALPAPALIPGGGQLTGPLRSGGGEPSPSIARRYSERCGTDHKLTAVAVVPACLIGTALVTTSAQLFPLEHLASCI